MGAGNKGALGRHWVGASAGAPGLGGPPDPPACRPRGVRRGVQVCHAGPELHLPGHVHPRHPAGAHVPRPVSAGPPKAPERGRGTGALDTMGAGHTAGKRVQEAAGVQAGLGAEGQVRAGTALGFAGQAGLVLGTSVRVPGRFRMGKGYHLLRGRGTVFYLGRLGWGAGHPRHGSLGDWVALGQGPGQGGRPQMGSEEDPQAPETSLGPHCTAFQNWAPRPRQAGRPSLASIRPAEVEMGAAGLWRPPW